MIQRRILESRRKLSFTWICVTAVIYVPLLFVSVNGFMMRFLMTTKKNNLYVNYAELFFSTWTLAAQIFFLGTAVCDILLRAWHGPSELQRFVHKTRSYIFHAYVVPMTLLTVSVFWCLYHYDRSLIYAEPLDVLVPNWLNHTLHTTIIIPIIVEFLLPKHEGFISAKTAVIGITILMVIYQALHDWIYHSTGIFLYPFYKGMGFGTRLICIFFLYILTCAFAVFGVYVQDLKKPSSSGKRSRAQRQRERVHPHNE